MGEEIVNIELTQEQFNHIKTILAQSKPSRTRLSKDEKDMICNMCTLWPENFSTNNYEDDLLKSIKKKLA